jgi:hypothetical protein
MNLIISKNIVKMTPAGSYKLLKKGTFWSVDSELGNRLISDNIARQPTWIDRIRFKKEINRRQKMANELGVKSI